MVWLGVKAHPQSLVTPPLTSSTSSSFNFNINLMETVMNVQPGGSANQNISLSYAGNSSYPVSLRANGYPPSVTISFDPDTCTPFCITTMTVSVSQGAQEGNYQVTITGNGEGVTNASTFTLNVGQVSTSTTTRSNSSVVITTNQPWFSVSCQPSTIVMGSATTCTAGVHDSNVSAPAATGVVSWVGSGPGGFSPAGFSASQCTLSGGACSVSYTPPSPVTPVKIMASYSGDSYHPQAGAQFTLNVTSQTTTITTFTITSGSITSTIATTMTKTFTGTTTAKSASGTAPTSGPTFPSLPSLSIPPIVPLAVMAAMIAASAAMAVNWLRVKRAAPKPASAEAGTQGPAKEEGSN